MKFSYTILRYRPDVATGEALNVGVIAYNHVNGQIGILTSRRYGRFSEAFAEFNGELHRKVLARLESALRRLAIPLTEGLFQLEERSRFEDITSIARVIWPDQGLAYFMGPVAFGVTTDLERDLHEIYDRYVGRQQGQEELSGRLDDEAVWNRVRKVLSPRGIIHVLQPKTFGEQEVEFQHAYKNEKWHVIEPVSLDYANASLLKNKALLTLGKAAAIQNEAELGSFTVIVGRPRKHNVEKKYREAMMLLKNLPVPNAEVVDSDHLEGFVDNLESDMRKHGVIS